MPERGHSSPHWLEIGLLSGDVSHGHMAFYVWNDNGRPRHIDDTALPRVSVG